MLISETLKGIKRTHGCAVARKTPILTDDLRLMLRYLPEKLLGVRDAINAIVKANAPGLPLRLVIRQSNRYRLEII
jgi:hypothetical protein